MSSPPRLPPDFLRKKVHELKDVRGQKDPNLHYSQHSHNQKYMAEAVTSVLVELADILREEAHELKDVRGQIEHVQKDLRLIEPLLKDLDSKCARNKAEIEWLNQVREITNRIANVIYTFRHKIVEYRAKSSNRSTRRVTEAHKDYETYKLGLHDELEKIIEELSRLCCRRGDLRIEHLGACDDVDDPEVVGLENDQRKIIEQLLDRNISRRTVLSIVGTGGLGKTTLAKKVYNSGELKGQFDCRVWQSISHTYDLNDLFREIIYSVDPHLKNRYPPLPDSDLPRVLKISLKYKRYLIILDDVWDINLLEQLKAIPDMYNASRMIITTRLPDVARAADWNMNPYKLCYLSDDEGLALLFRNAFQQHVQPENYPAELLDVAKRLTKKCGGIPLALIVLGGILTRRDRKYTAWNTLDETMDWHDEDRVQCLLHVLAIGYEDLPRYLKDCFLYFALFPEEYKISGEHITRLWMAEGLVQKDGAEKCLEELVERCLVQVTKKPWNDKYYSIHHPLWDLAIREAEENFFAVFSKEEEVVHNLAVSKKRRVSKQRRDLQQPMQGEDRWKKVQILEELLVNGHSCDLQQCMKEEDLGPKVQILEHLLLNGPSCELQQCMQEEDRKEKVRILEELLLVNGPSCELQQCMQEEDREEKVRILEELLLVNGPSHELQQPMQGEDLGQKVRILEDLLLVDGASHELQKHMTYARRRSR